MKVSIKLVVGKWERVCQSWDKLVKNCKELAKAGGNIKQLAKVCEVSGHFGTDKFL